MPLPFVHMATPIYLQHKAWRGPTFRETLLMHAVARIAYHGDIDNIQVSWVKMGVEGARQVLQAGANDVGGTLMDENIRGRPAHRTVSGWGSKSSSRWLPRWAGPWCSARRW